MPRRWPGGSGCWWNSSSLLSRFKQFFLGETENSRGLFLATGDEILSVHRYIVTTIAALLRGAGRICPENWKLLVLLKTRDSQLRREPPPTDNLTDGPFHNRYCTQRTKNKTFKQICRHWLLAPLKVRGFGFIGQLNWAEHLCFEHPNNSIMAVIKTLTFSQNQQI